MLLMSTIWAAEADYNLKNLNGTANLNLVSSDINTTSMSLSVNDYLLLDVDKINNRYNKNSICALLGTPWENLNKIKNERKKRVRKRK